MSVSVQIPGRKRFEALPSSAVVFRLARRNNKNFYPDETRDFPTYSVFNVSRDDREEAKLLGRSPAISVYEHGLTTVEEAVAIRKDQPGTNGVVYLTVSDVSECHTDVVPPCQPLETYASPLDTVAPGSHGHSAIEGIERPGSKPAMQRAIKIALHKKARLIP